MSKLDLTAIANLQNENTVITALNSNSILTEDALENTLSRDGTSPNQMEATLDMNSNPIVNLPASTSPDMPVTRQELDDAVLGDAPRPTVTGTTNEITSTLAGSNYTVSLPSSINLTGKTLTGGLHTTGTVRLEALTAGPVAAQSDGTLYSGTQAVPSFWDIKGLECNGFSNTIMQMSATSVVFYNPNNATALYSPPGSDVIIHNCDLTSTGAGGRDAAFTPALNDEVWFYFIKGSATSLNVLISKTAPLGTNANATLGPILPTGYTAYCPAFPFVLGDTSGFSHDSHQDDEVSRQTFTGSTSTNHLFTSAEPSGPLTIGWKLYGAGVPSDTFIVSMESHSGTGGSYTLSKTVGTIGSETMSVSQPFPYGVLVRDKKVWFKGTILDNVTNNVGFVSVYSWPYARWVPSVAKTIDVELDPEITANSTITQAALVTVWGEGNDLNLSSYAYTSTTNTTAQNVVAEFPVSSTRTMGMIYLQGAGATLTTTTVNFLRGYTF